jgi:RimJ/RimL family protein N-acetyltransferase
MTLYSGLDLNFGPVSLCLPDPHEIENAVIAPDTVEARSEWLQRAMSGPDTLYFAVRLDGMLAGQVFLYDLGNPSGEAQVGMHLFDPAVRGRGVGAAALALLQQYVSEQTSLKHLSFQVEVNHAAARRAAEKCGFACRGKSKSDSQQLIYTWNVLTG